MLRIFPFSNHNHNYDDSADDNDVSDSFSDFGDEIMMVITKRPNIFVNVSILMIIWMVNGHSFTVEYFLFFS